MDFPSDIEMIEKQKTVHAAEMEINSESQSSENEAKTNWRLIIVTGIVSGLNAVENSVIGMGEWPYMKEIDNDATAQFFGFSQSAAKCGHAIFALLFSIWSYKSRSVKIPMLASRLIAIVACCIYLSIEFFPSGKRYTLMTVYILLSVANSASTVLRGYIVMISSSQDRAKAFAIIGLSAITSIVIGPALQLLFSGIVYPGYEVVPGIRFHIFSVPIWCSLILTVITAVIICVYMDDVHRRVSTENQCDSGSKKQLISIEIIKETVENLRNSGLNWRLIGVCLFVKIAVTFLSALLGSIMSIIFMVLYGWTGSETVRLGSTLMIAFGVISCTVLFLYIFCRLGEILRQEKVFVACVFAVGTFFVVTYPFDFNSQPVAPYNATTRAGCNPAEYAWCEGSLAVKPNYFMYATVLFFAPCLPMMHTALDTVYSQILGNIDQNVAHGAMTVVDDVVFMITPIFTTTIFTLLGIGPLWIMKAAMFFFIATVWLFHIKQIGEAL
ncbi:unnamed protein product [Caenorhabditis sp. 36 PRJEB53466]|nr:unnamed protein product [Caenorhabditis sp. 36 PRJEB53466]